MVFKPGHKRIPGSGRKKGQGNKPKPIEKIIIEKTVKALCKQLGPQIIARLKATVLPPLENQRKTKLEKIRRKRLANEQQFTEDAGSFHRTPRNQLQRPRPLDKDDRKPGLVERLPPP